MTTGKVKLKPLAENEIKTGMPVLDLSTKLIWIVKSKGDNGFVCENLKSKQLVGYKADELGTLIVEWPDEDTADVHQLQLIITQWVDVFKMGIVNSGNVFKFEVIDKGIVEIVWGVKPSDEYLAELDEYLAELVDYLREFGVEQG